MATVGTLNVRRSLRSQRGGRSGRGNHTRMTLDGLVKEVWPCSMSYLLVGSSQALIASFQLGYSRWDRLSCSPS